MSAFSGHTWMTVRRAPLTIPTLVVNAGTREHGIAGAGCSMFIIELLENDSHVVSRAKT